MTRTLPVLSARTTDQVHLFSTTMRMISTLLEGLQMETNYFHDIKDNMVDLFTSCRIDLCIAIGIQRRYHICYI